MFRRAGLNSSSTKDLHSRVLLIPGSRLEQGKEKLCVRAAAGALPPAGLTTLSPGAALSQPAWEVLNEGTIAQPV